MIKKELFDVFNGNEVYRYTVTDKISVSLIDFGARIVDIVVPDRNGCSIDVSLNMKNVKDIIENGDYMGATVGRCANRIGKGSFEIDGKSYKVWHEDNAAHLHGGKVGFDKKIFSCEAEDNNCVLMRYESPDGEEGYPGTVSFTVKFTVIGARLIIEYFAQSDKDTVFNVTNHTYFNLNGESDGSILDNILKINADSYLPVDKMLIPTGEIKPVEGTPFDFREEKCIGRDIDLIDKDLLITGGYDHNFCITDGHFAMAYSEKTGIVMDCYTDRPGVQFYAGGSLKGQIGKSKYNRRSGFCLETQLYPDAIHNPNWQSPILKKGEKFYSKTEYAFSTKK